MDCKNHPGAKSTLSNNKINPFPVENLDATILQKPAITAPVPHSISIAETETTNNRTRHSLILLTNICFITGIITPIAMFLFFATHNLGFGLLPVILVCAIISFYGFFAGIAMSIVLLLCFLFARFRVSDVARRLCPRCLLGILISLVPVVCGLFLFYIW